MKHLLFSVLLSTMATVGAQAQQPVYLDHTRPVEERINDAIS